MQILNFEIPTVKFRTKHNPFDKGLTLYYDLKFKYKKIFMLHAFELYFNAYKALNICNIILIKHIIIIRVSRVF